MQHVLGIDLGTSSLKAILLGEDGAVAGAITRSYPIDVPRPGWAEQAPEDWWAACCAATRALLQETGVAAGEIAVVAVGGQMHGTVLLDEAAVPLRPAVIWPDQRAATEAAQADAALAGEGLLPSLGGGVAAGFMLATLLWIREHEPRTWAATATALLPKDYLRYRFTGVPASEPSDGSGIPAVDLATWDWSDAALAALNLPRSILPTLCDSTAPAGKITDTAAQESGLLAGTPVLCGGSDQAMAAIGAGVLQPGTLLISISTGGQLVTPLREPLPAPERGLRTVCHAVPAGEQSMGRYLGLSATLGAGLSLRWLREEVFGDRADGNDARLVAEAAKAPAGARGLLFLPYLAGERAPLLDPGASGALIGLRLDHGRAHLARAALEGVAFSLRHALEPLQEAGVRVEQILLAGGAARSALMRAIMADVLEQPVLSLETDEQSALGAALLAGVHAGFFSSLAQACATAVRYGAPVDPDPERSALYGTLYARYRALYPALQEDMHALRRIDRRG